MWSLLLWLGCQSSECEQDDVVGDGIDQNCDGRDGVDSDGDGQASIESGGIDCDDNDLGILAISYYVDSDHDGWGSEYQEVWLCPEDIALGLENDMLVAQSGDCNDNDARIYPEAEEVCDGVDNDCDEEIDQEDDTLNSLTTIRIYADTDGDGWGDINNSFLACNTTAGWVLNNRDCDDNDAAISCIDSNCHTGLCEYSIELDALHEVQFDFTRIPAGSGWIGSEPSESASEPEEQRIEISLSEDLWMLNTPVTMKMYEHVMERTPSMFHHSPLCSEHHDCPVESVSWHDAAKFSNLLTALFNTNANNSSNNTPRTECYSCDTQDFCMPIDDFISCTGVRLPTEVEWEYAARAGTDAPFWTPDSNGALGGRYIANAGCGRDWTLENGISLEEYGWFCANNVGDFEDPFYGSKPVALKQPNGFGLFDIVGGIWEMTNDRYEDERSITTSIQENPYVPILEWTDSVVRKGGMWGDPPSDLRAARREPVSLDYQNGDVGFRVVMRP